MDGRRRFLVVLASAIVLAALPAAPAAAGQPSCRRAALLADLQTLDARMTTVIRTVRQGYTPGTVVAPVATALIAQSRQTLQTDLTGQTLAGVPANTVMRRLIAFETMMTTAGRQAASGGLTLGAFEAYVFAAGAHGVRLLNAFIAAGQRAQPFPTALAQAYGGWYANTVLILITLVNRDGLNTVLSRHDGQAFQNSIATGVARLSQARQTGFPRDTLFGVPANQVLGAFAGWDASLRSARTLANAAGQNSVGANVASALTAARQQVRTLRQAIRPCPPG